MVVFVPYKVKRFRIAGPLESRRHEKNGGQLTKSVCLDTSQPRPPRQARNPHQRSEVFFLQQRLSCFRGRNKEVGNSRSHDTRLAHADRFGLNISTHYQSNKRTSQQLWPQMKQARNRRCSEVGLFDSNMLDEAAGATTERSIAVATAIRGNSNVGIGRALFRICHEASNQKRTLQATMSGNRCY